MSEEINLDLEAQKRAQQASDEIEQKTAQAITDMNEQLAEEQAEEARRQAQIQAEAAVYGEAARSRHTDISDEDSDSTINFNMAPNADEYGQTLGTSSMSPEALKQHIDKMNANRTITPDPTATTEQNGNGKSENLGATTPTPATTAEQGGNGNGGNGGNNGLNSNNLGASAAGQPQPTQPNNQDDLKGVYATEEMFSARFVPQPFYLSDRFKNTWKECMKGFQEAKDPAEAIEELFWGFANLAPKMAIAYMFHLDDQEIQRKRDAQHDKEEYDQQLLLMKRMSPAEFHKHKCDWLFGSEELHKYLKERQPDLPTDDYEYVDIRLCSDEQKKQVREHVENFIKNEPHYKEMIENFTHREFSQDELNREARGMAPAIFRMQGKPQNLTQTPVNEASASSASGPDRPTPPTSPKGPTNGPDRPTPPTSPKGPQQPTPPTPPRGPQQPTPPETNVLLELTQYPKQKVQGTPSTGSLKNIRPVDTTQLRNQAWTVCQDLAHSSDEIRRNRSNGAAIQAAMAGRPYAPRQTGYEYGQQNMGRVA